MTSGMYNNSIKSMGLAKFNWLNSGGSTVKCQLTYTTQPDQTHEYETSVAGELGASGGYSTNGETMALVDAAITGTDPTVYCKFDSADTAWSTFTAGPCRWAVVYKYTGTPASDPLFSFHDFGADKTGGGGTFTVVWDTNGVARIQITDAA